MAGNELTLQLINSGATIGNDGIVAESMMLNQAILNSGVFKLGGCIASCFSLRVFDPGVPLKDEEIQVYIKEDGKEKDIPLFHGKITDAKKNNDTGTIAITAYDALGIAGDKQATVMPILLRSVFSGTMNDLSYKSGIEVLYDKTVYYQIAPEYNVGFGYYSEPMTIAEVLSGICEMLGGFGFIDGEGIFRLVEPYSCGGDFTKILNSAGNINLYIDENSTHLKVIAGKPYTILSNATSGHTDGLAGMVTVEFYDEEGFLTETVSGHTPFTVIPPSSPYESVYAVLAVPFWTANYTDRWTWIEGEEKKAVDVIPMQDTNHEDYTTDKITGVQYFYKNNETEEYETVLFGSNENPYTITSGMFKSIVQKDEIAKELYERIRNIPQFTPVESMPSLGYPETVNAGTMVNNGTITTFVFERTLTGIQGLRDVYIADVDKRMSAIEASEATAC